MPRGQEQATAFEVVPAVDILGEEAIRLLRGDYGKITTREADPFALIERVVRAGADVVHVVDLTAARTGAVRPELIARAVAAAGTARVQAAGGVRSTADAEALVAAGAERIVVGTAAFGANGLLEDLVSTLGERLVVAIDVRDGLVAVNGWTRATSLSVSRAIARCVAAGVGRLMCTAIERDGTLTGPSLDLLADVCHESGLPVLAAGGIRSTVDLAAVEAVGCEGAIVGRALLDGLVPLAALASRSDE
jgi:phosphoribosylformimino-5-aminoimidazole carboxamide ribotide isomerase